jgi:hypothetical protein
LAIPEFFRIPWRGKNLLPLLRTEPCSKSVKLLMKYEIVTHKVLLSIESILKNAEQLQHFVAHDKAYQTFTFALSLSISCVGAILDRRRILITTQ